MGTRLQPPAGGGKKGKLGTDGRKKSFGAWRVDSAEGNGRKRDGGEGFSPAKGEKKALISCSKRRGSTGGGGKKRTVGGKEIISQPDAS